MLLILCYTSYDVTKEKKCTLPWRFPFAFIAVYLSSVQKVLIMIVIVVKASFNISGMGISGVLKV